ncbi:MAG TPA: hypothetical protein VK425_08305 [Acidimicrobiales bacterium]|nr:hypothetical protein [Acidimicrobiales bacterium]
MNEQTLDTRWVVRALWRRRLFVALLIAFGLAAGVAYSMYNPNPATARALVLLPAGTVSSTGNPAADDATQVIIARSTPVLAAAGAAVSPPVSAQDLRNKTAVTGLSDEVLQVQVTDNSGANAITLANAVATDYIVYVTKTVSSSSAVLTALRQQANLLTQQVLALQDAINATSARIAGEGATSANGLRDTAELGTLKDQQEQVSLQLNNINSQIFSAQLSGSIASNGTRILQRATLVPSSRLGQALKIAVGGLLGLLVASVIALVRARNDRRLRLRDELAEVVGVPVLVSLEAGRCRSVKDWARLLERHEPSAVDTWNARRVLYRLARTEADEVVDVTIVVLAEDGPALAASVQLAKSASTLGLPVNLLPGPHPALAALRLACQARQGPGDGGVLTFLSADGALSRSSTLKVALEAVDDKRPDMPSGVAAGLLAVSAGAWTAEVLARLAVAASDAGWRFDGILVVNPAPDDNTTGSLPNNEVRPAPVRAHPRVGSELSGGQPR